MYDSEILATVSSYVYAHGKILAEFNLAVGCRSARFLACPGTRSLCYLSIVGPDEGQTLA